MRYYKFLQEGFIVAIGIGCGGEEIKKAEYDYISGLIAQRPGQEGYGHRLKTDMTWERFELPVEADLELTEAEVLDIILGGEIG